MSNFSKISFEECKQMSSRLIAMNPNRNANMGKISSYLLDYYTELTKQPWLSTLVGQIRDLTAKQNQMLQQAADAVDASLYANEDDLAFAIIKKQEEVKAGETFKQLDKQISVLKKQLPFRSPHYFHFLDDHRAQKTIDPETFTFQTTVDIDNPEEVETAVKNALLLNGMFDDPQEKLFREKIFSADDIELWKGKVLHVERSARNKAHIDIRIPVGMTIAEAQSAFCKLIHATEDPSCVTPERIIFITDAVSQIYTADDWYKRLDEEAVAEYREAYRKRGLDIDGRPLDVDSAQVRASQNPYSSQKSSSQNSSSQSSSSFAPTVDFQPVESEEEKARRTANAAQYEQTYDGVPYEEIVKALVDLMGGAPAHGNRNNFIYREACLLRYICNSEAAWIKQVIEIFGEDEVKAFASVESACKVAQSSEMPQLVKQAVDLARKNYLAKQATEKAGIYADVPPQMPARLPKLIKLLTSKVPADFKPAVAMAVFPPLAAHLKGVTFRYIDNQVHEAAMMNLLVAPMSSGKSAVNGPIDCIIDDLVQMDKVNRQKEQDWKDEVNTMGDNKKKPVRPEDICIRIVSPDLTRAAYIQRLDDVQKAGGAYLYCKMDEVDMLRKFNDPSQLIRLCWDNSEDGQERVGTKSVTARVKTRFNWNASSTIAVTQKFFSVREVADGAVSRLSLATIFLPEFAPCPVVGNYDAQFKSQLAPYIHQLNATSGFKECRKARQLIERLGSELMELAQLAYNKPYAEFAKRSLANGFRRAMVLYLANGEKWEKAIEDFIVWSVKYDLWCKMRFFGNQMQEAIDADTRSIYHASGVSNLLLFVHDTFDKAEIQEVCMVHGTKTKLAVLLCTWKKRGFIVKNDDDTFSKTAKFIAKYGHYGTPGMAA
ncbi:hypothetical protein CFT61_15850 [Segatella copri]|uniref:DUF3987 domain-containing protein n=1 Tax=Segatella copri TaxID=165179 RepID=A0AA91TGX0_9BACT|nr:hypothetical protein [Segatella copri]OXL42558.1 hypothetical protein CFT61_15850 [Segatella copri]